MLMEPRPLTNGNGGSTFNLAESTNFTIGGDRAGTRINLSERLTISDSTLKSLMPQPYLLHVC